MLTISLKAHWQVASIMLSECRLHNKQGPKWTVGNGLNCEVKLCSLWVRAAEEGWRRRGSWKSYNIHVDESLPPSPFPSLSLSLMCTPPLKYLLTVQAA